MMGSCSLWLLLVALLPPVRIAPVFCQHTEDMEDHRLTFLVTIKSNGSGLKIHTCFPGNQGNEEIRSQPELESQAHFIPNHSLSSECGDQYFQCRQLLVESLSTQTTSGNVNIIFVPLEGAVLLLSYWYDSDKMTLEMSSFTVTSPNCCPTVFFKFNGSIYTVCVHSYTGYFAVYEVQLRVNGTATLIGELTKINNPLHSSNFTNFVIIEDKVYFAVSNIIAALNFLNSTQTSIIQSPDSGCDQIHKLVSANNCAEEQPTLLAYCTCRYFYICPLSSGDWRESQLFKFKGVQYPCPDNKYRATLFNDTSLQFSRSNLLLNTISVNISSGVCFKSQNITYFAYSDQQNNTVFVYDFEFFTHNPYRVSPYDCPPQVQQDCPQSLFLENQYLVICDASHSLVFDATTNFSLVINISSDISDIFAILHSNVYGVITPSPPIIHSTTTAKAPLVPESPTAVGPVRNTNNLVRIVSIVTIGFFAIIAILVIVAIGFFIRHWRKKRGKSVYRIPRLMLITKHRGRPLLVSESTQEQEEEEEEESENHEMESMINLREPRHFGKGWRSTTTV